MVDRAERDPTMEEIVVALRETRQAAGRAVPFAVVNGQRAVDQAAGAADARNAIDVAELRDSEIQRLLAENANLNQRVMSLLKLLEQQPARSVTHAASDSGAPSDAGHNAISRAVRAAMETQLRPVLDVLLHLLETLRGTSPRRAPSPPAAPHHDAGIIDLDAPPAHE
jgi:hypothetical protein